MRCVAFGLNRARTLRSGMESPLSVLCIHRCSMTVSARCFIMATIQSPAFTAPGVPGTRGPNATCCCVYDHAESALNAVFGREGNLSHATSESARVATVSTDNLMFGISLFVAEELHLQHRRQDELRLATIEVV